MAERCAVVTGVSKGLGEAIAANLVARGFHVVGVGRSASARLTSPAFRLERVDLADVAALASLADGLFSKLAARTLASIAVVNNAAVAGPVGTFGALASADIAASLTVNLASPAIIAGDADELKAAVMNLIDNAVKYSGSDPRINISLAETADGSRYALKVIDRGPGISPNELKRVFRRFYRIHGMSVRTKGSGLGLFIVRSVAKRHGGKAFAESAGQGQGSTFTILLPRSSEPA